MEAKVVEKSRALDALPAEERAGLFTPEERASHEAAERYSALAHEANAALHRLLLKGGEEVTEFCYLLCRIQAANELRCAMARCGQPSLHSTFGAGAPFELLNRDGIEVVRKQILREVMS